MRDGHGHEGNTRRVEPLMPATPFLKRADRTRHMDGLYHCLMLFRSWVRKKKRRRIGLVSQQDSRSFERAMYSHTIGIVA